MYIQFLDRMMIMPAACLRWCSSRIDSFFVVMQEVKTNNLNELLLQ